MTHMSTHDRPNVNEHPYFQLRRDENERVYRRFVDEILTECRTDTLEELVDERFVMERAGDTEPLYGREDLAVHVSAYHRAVPDLDCELESTVTAGDRLAARWTMTGTHEGVFWGTAPTGSRVTLRGMEFVRIQNGRILERWVVVDTHELRE